MPKQGYLNLVVKEEVVLIRILAGNREREKEKIYKNPAKGYPKLQAILQTIMLHCTKGTTLNAITYDHLVFFLMGNQVIELKKVEFTEEERDFYSRLETDSRTQFKSIKYAAAGTVKQNYVNILLMRFHTCGLICGHDNIDSLLLIMDSEIYRFYNLMRSVRCVREVLAPGVVSYPQEFYNCPSLGFPLYLKGFLFPIIFFSSTLTDLCKRSSVGTIAKVKGKASKTFLSKEDWCGLESPAHVIAIPVDPKMTPRGVPDMGSHDLVKKRGLWGVLSLLGLISLLQPYRYWYAAAGTVKQNYVNILLMLCAFAKLAINLLLVRGFDSNSLGRLSIETAKNLPQEKPTFLLSCLASLALCGICNDPPEDAVVAVCGHVFCNQCVSEHLSGDDNQCPTTNCKVRLSASSVFSNATLKSTLFGQPGRDSSLNCSGSHVVEVIGPHSEDCSYDSSKIKAALQVLQSLAKPQDHSLKSSGCPEGLSDLHSGVSPNGVLDEKNLDAGESLNDSCKVLGEKAIVFSQWTRMLDLFEGCLKSSSIQYRRLDGTMSVAARDKAVKDFNTLPEVSVMIMSLKAASLGLNMVAACHVLLLDLWWNPTTEDQAIDRAHRIGQTRPVTVLRLTVKDTVEDRILALQQKKREMVASAFGEDETGGRQTRLTVEDLEYLFMA
ncbi:helicase-like transcription factor CHR28 [Herrania umbratica]|uniref:Helicase-like transcription factor CHR28 n=1 Tax=Herrania umbratica TaxID=108875 RepID=A0A6J1B5V3_9ROSI|nr:helicase-like transcription factor CHR28 [Herrania umbratica]